MFEKKKKNQDHNSYEIKEDIAERMAIPWNEHIVNIKYNYRGIQVFFVVFFIVCSQSIKYLLHASIKMKHTHTQIHA